MGFQNDPNNPNDIQTIEQKFAGNDVGVVKAVITKDLKIQLFAEYPLTELLKGVKNVLPPWAKNIFEFIESKLPKSPGPIVAQARSMPEPEPMAQDFKDEDTSGTFRA
jgi:hypothetical protein